MVEENDELVIRFEYRPDGEKRRQDAINADTAKRVIADLNDEKLAAWKDRLAVMWKRAGSKETDKTILDKHLFDYTRRNTFDYFIHKDLEGFLRRELDFYIKNEVMRLDDIEEESAPRVEQYLSKIKVIRRIAHKIIDFLAQIENFQKKLWLKKKFVVETNYCMTLDRVPEELYPEIAANNAQREEWVRLFAIDEIEGDLHTPSYAEPLTVEFLKANDNLILDTAFFPVDFKYRLLVAIEDIDTYTDGLLVHSDNFQALSCLEERYRRNIECIHIDPPYNTATSGFLYKNTYQHSSWLAMMLDRAVAAAELLANDGAFQCHIDENEYESLYQVLDTIGLPDAGTIIWDKKNPMLGRKGIATQHEYVIWRGWCDGPIYLGSTSVRQILSAAKNIISKHSGVNDASRREFSQWMNKQPDLTGGERAYKLLSDDGRVFRGVAMGAPEYRTNDKFHIPLIHPITGKECPVPPNGWSRSPETLQALIDQDEILFGKDETTQPNKKVFLTEKSKRQVSSVIEETGRGKQDVLALGVEFPYCHPVSLYEKLLGAGVSTHGAALDYFAGSGTTGHAIVNLNREDNGSRKYILVEMGDHFDAILKPRIQKVVYSKDWKDGKPVSRKGVSHMFKYIRLESYEDALANIECQRTGPQQLLIDKAGDFRESYMLKYMLDVESRGSQTLLNIENFDDPWNYKLLVGAGSVGETRPVNVDLVETFNWLLGLKVKHIDRIRGFRVIEGENPKGEKVLVIWRKVRDLDETDIEKIAAAREHANHDLEAFFRKQQYNTLDSEFDVIYVNGDNNLMNVPLDPDKEGVEPRYKVRLIEEEFKRLMFDVAGA